MHRNTCPDCPSAPILRPWQNAYKDQEGEWWFQECPKCKYQWAEWKLVKYGRMDHVGATYPQNGKEEV